VELYFSLSLASRLLFVLKKKKKKQQQQRGVGIFGRRAFLSQIGLVCSGFAGSVKKVGNICTTRSSEHRFSRMAGGGRAQKPVFLLIVDPIWKLTD